MMLQEAQDPRGDSATPWWQPPLHLLFDWLPERRERKRKAEGGREVGWLWGEEEKVEGTQIFINKKKFKKKCPPEVFNFWYYIY